MSEQISAFAVYSRKRKNTQENVTSRKIKKKHASFRDERVEKRKTAQSKIKQIPKDKNNIKLHKVPLNKTRTVNINAKRNLSSKKVGVSVAVKKKPPIRKLANKNINNVSKVILMQGAKKIDAIPKLKISKKKVNSKVLQIKAVKQKEQKTSKAKKLINNVKLRSSPRSIPRLTIDFETPESDHENPMAIGRSMFEWLMHPTNIDDFFEKHWEKTPVHIRRGCPNYYKQLMSTPKLDKILRESYILFTQNLDITSYENGVRETHNPPGRAVPSVVWDYYMNGCSIRMLNPQTYIPKLHSLNATLQEFFGCFVGANSYLTPPNSQGFAPHYDDIEAFILQVEGKKRWRLYKPLNKNEYLPRYSSKNFEQHEIGEPILDTIVNAGDLLYFPRGTIHQGETIDDTHSLHITLSVYQKNSWGDYLERLLPNALRTAIQTDSEFREGLPLDYLRYCGYVHSANHTTVRKLFKDKVESLCSRLIQYIDVNKAADLMARNHMHDFLPPVLSENEKECSVVLDGEEMTANGIVRNRVEIEPDTRIRLLRSHCIRLVEEEGFFRIYYSTENSKQYHEYESQFLEIIREFVPAVQAIILSYPEFIRVEDLPIDGVDNKIQIVKDLWEKCIVVTDNPLCILE